MARRRIPVKEASETDRAPGIRDWDRKLDALDVLFDAYTRPELARAILGCTVGGANEGKYHDSDVEYLAGSFKSWFDHRPKGQTGRRFVKELASRLGEMGCEGFNIHGTIVNGTYGEFRDLIPADHRRGLEPVESGIRTDDLQPDDAAFHAVWASRSEMLEMAKEVRAGIARNRIDQKLYYLSPDSADIWKAVIEAQEYPQYEQCKTALSRFVGNDPHWQKTEPLWRAFISDEKADGIVVLGAGAPSKDLVIIRSLLKLASLERRLHYALVDCSYYMTMSSFQMVDRALLQDGSRRRIDLKSVNWDFMNLTGVRSKLRRKGKNVAWFIPGGTIGNLNERLFFRAIASQAEVGDLLVIGADTVGPESVAELRAPLVEKYGHSAVHSFVGAPLRAVWHQLGMKGRLEDTLRSIDIDLVDGVRNEHSFVEGAKTVEVSLTLEGQQKIVLLTSTRYREEAFLAFAEREGFKHEETVPSPLNPAYKQLVFRYFPKPVNSGTIVLPVASAVSDP